MAFSSAVGTPAIASGIGLAGLLTAWEGPGGRQEPVGLGGGAIVVAALI